MLRLLSTSFLRPLFRSSPGDRICLRTIEWVHEQHEETRHMPAAFADDACSIAPIVQISPIYFFPCLEQRGLLYQPLFFHEFGHVLYQVHEKELDELVFDLQRSISTRLSPLSQRNDRYSDAQAADLQSVVDAWYHWTQELFCDAVGLSIGGPSFLEAFSAYMHQLEMGDFYLPPEHLRGSSHPITWLRIRYLIFLAREWGLSQTADAVESLWEETRTGLLRRFTDVEALGRTPATEGAAAEWPALLNEAWLRFRQSADDYRSWERKECVRILAASTSA
jgi:hypothetical protein